MFLALIDREAPGKPEKLAALIYIDHGATYYFDHDGPKPHNILKPTEDALKAQCEQYSLSDRRAVMLDDSKLNQLKELIGKPVNV